MKLMKKAQGATEYLIILAVVIIIALIVIGVMGGIPGIGRSGSNRASQAYWSSQNVAITSSAISASGTDTIIVKNNNNNPVVITSLVVNGVNVASSENLGVGASYTYTGSIAACTAGQAYTYSTYIYYQDTKTSAYYNITGDGNKLEGTCAN